MICWPELPGVFQPQTCKAWFLFLNDALKTTQHLLLLHETETHQTAFLSFFSPFFLAPLANETQCNQ